jgi:acetolactate synthase-1/2/3 large subunit
MSGMELLTLAREKLPVTVIVFRDGHLNLIRLHQERDYGHAFATEVVGPDPEALADAAGVGFLPLDGDPTDGIRAALASPGPVLVDLPLKDSPRIRSARRSAALKAGVRQVVGEGWVERLKKLLGR